MHEETTESILGRSSFFKIYPWCLCLVVIGIEQPTADSIWTTTNMSFSVNKKSLLPEKETDWSGQSHNVFLIHWIYDK
jgi:hypothetical protein